MPALRLPILPTATPTPPRPLARAALACALLLVCSTGAVAQDHSPAAPKAVPKPASASSNPAAKAIGQQVREAVAAGIDPNKQVTLMVDGKEKHIVPTAPPRPAATPAAAVAHGPAPTIPVAHGAIPNPVAARQQSLRARAAAVAGHGITATGGDHGGEVHWSYEGEGGPQSWGKLKPEFNVCAIGKRQSPINIEETATLRGPAEPIQFDYAPSTASVVNNGHTIQVDVVGENSITVRSTHYKLLQFHFHHPSEERVNFRSFAMVVHLVHRNPEGQLAVVAVLLDPGEANPLINKVWTHMPLDSGDRVRMPPGVLNLNELLPKDQRYYQFIGSLTTPPCTEGVLWMVLKQPVAISREQLRLFSQLFPNNARPVQPVNGRAIRDAQ